MELYRNRRQQVTDLGFEVRGDVIRGYGMGMNAVDLSSDSSEEKFKALLSKLEKEKAAYLAAEKEHIKNEIIEEEKREIEIE